MRRRKAPRVVWLPPTNANALGVAATAGYQRFSVDVAGVQGDFTVGEIPLVIDSQSDPLDTANVNSLSDIENSGYRLRRVVGKIFVIRRQQINPNIAVGDLPSACIITAGIIVRRADDQTGSSLAASNANGPELTSPGEIRNWGDPWVWRRTWVLTDRTMVSLAALNSWPVDSPTSNFSGGTGGNADGPHVDQKTARLVSAEERLFLTVSATILEQGSAPALTADHTVLTDLRVLGSMRVSTGNRRNASR